MTGQAPRHVVLVRPHHFRPNPQTEGDNAFQITGDNGSLSIDVGFDSIRADLEDGRSVVTSTPPGWLLGGAPDGDVVDGHVHIVEGLSTNEEGEEVVVLVNPWGTPQPPASKPPVLELTQEEYAANFVSRNTVDHEA
ncbi:hypothetical protein [Brachybacterium sp.]|uniref:hypothetical protein n=1 Tax=Brachybacterium sp. TaxID=1891286 RepID=UPI002ED4842E